MASRSHGPHSSLPIGKSRQALGSLWRALGTILARILASGSPESGLWGEETLVLPVRVQLDSPGPSQSHRSAFSNPQKGVALLELKNPQSRSRLGSLASGAAGTRVFTSNETKGNGNGTC